MNHVNKITLYVAMLTSLLFFIFTPQVQSNFKNSPTIDFSINGDLSTQNLNFIGEYPVECLNGNLTGKYFLTRHDGSTLAESYTLQLESKTARKFLNRLAGGAIIEYEGDLPIKNDPFLHLTAFVEGTVYDNNQEGNRVAKIGVGVWGEGRQLGKPLECPDNLASIDCDEYRRYLTGVRAHLDIKYDRFSVLVECLPRMNFDQFRFSASPELEIKLVELWGKQFSFVLMGEIDYYSQTSDLTIEPLLDLTKPWETRLTYLFRREI